MVADWNLAASVRKALVDTDTIREVKMFGGIGFMLNGNLLVGASPRGLLVRVGKDRQSQALARSGTRPMVMKGRTMDGYVYIDPPALDDGAVQMWIELAIAFVHTLPAKTKPSVKQKPRQTKKRS